MEQLLTSHWINLIFSWLSLGDIGRTDETWRMLYRRDLSEVIVPPDNDFRSAYRQFIQELSQINRGRREWILICRYGYEKLFLAHRDQGNMKYNIQTITETLIESGHLDLLRYYRGYLKPDPTHDRRDCS